MGEGQRFELGGLDLKALDLDQLLEAVRNEEEAVGIEIVEVAGERPRVGVDGARRRLGVVEIARERCGPRNQISPVAPTPRDLPVAGSMIIACVLGSSLPEEPDRTSSLKSG